MCLTDNCYRICFHRHILCMIIKDTYENNRNYFRNDLALNKARGRNLINKIQAI